MWGIELERGSFAEMLSTCCSYCLESSDHFGEAEGEPELTLPVAH